MCLPLLLLYNILFINKGSKRVCSFMFWNTFLLKCKYYEQVTQLPVILEHWELLSSAGCALFKVSQSMIQSPLSTLLLPSGRAYRCQDHCKKNPKAWEIRKGGESGRSLLHVKYLLMKKRKGGGKMKTSNIRSAEIELTG